MQLVELPFGSKPTGRYERFSLLHESGSVSHATGIAYTVPRVNERAFEVPASFFLQGWVHALEDREVAAYLALCQLGAMTNEVALSAGARLRYYGLPRTTYESFATLEKFGLVESFPDPNRRPDGTIEGHSKGETGLLNRYRLTDGVRELGVKTVLSALNA
jgi:hypothetical protein